MNPAITRQLMRELGQPGAPAPVAGLLNDREIEVLKSMVRGPSLRSARHRCFY